MPALRSETKSGLEPVGGLKASFVGSRIRLKTMASMLVTFVDLASYAALASLRPGLRARRPTRRVRKDQQSMSSFAHCAAVPIAGRGTMLGFHYARICTSSAIGLRAGERRA